MNSNRWILFALAAIVLAAGVGLMAYNAGVAHGIAQSGKIVAPPAGYVWHPWGFGFPYFFFFPFFFFLFFVFAARAFFRRGRYHRHGYGCGYRPAEQGGAPQQQ